MTMSPPWIMTSFSAWLRRQKDRDDAIGDLARDWIADPDAPRAASPRQARTHIDLMGASAAALKTLDRAAEKWASSGSS
jgi:hypothetical protein